jgi:TBC1 domain family member 15
MVEIKRSEAGPSKHETALPEDFDEGKYRLLYAKSKVYVHPTAYSRDNIPGFVTLVKRVCQLVKSVARVLMSA